MNKYVKVSSSDVPVYTPPGHDDTYNKRLIGPHNGAVHVELILGEMGRTGHAESHYHSEFEQCMYLLTGRLSVTGDGEDVVLEAGDTILFTKNSIHKVVCETDKATFLVIYTPPRESSEEAVHRGYQ